MFSISQNIPFFTREYRNDFKQDATGIAETTIRVAKVALPFIALHQPLARPLSIGLGALRAVNEISSFISCYNKKTSKENIYKLFHITLAVASVAASIFAHPVGMLISTAQDIILETENLILCINEKRTEDAIVSCVKIISSLFYLALCLNGGLELAIISLALQLLIGLYQARAEVKQGNYLEATGHLLMALIRANELKAQVSLLHTKWFVHKNEVLELFEDSQLEDCEISGNLAADVSNNLGGMLTEDEMLYVIDKLDQNGRIDHKFIFTLAKVRNKDRPFSSMEILKFTKIFGAYDKKWFQEISKNSFWKTLHTSTFADNQNLFPQENEHVNYEMRRLNWYLLKQKELGQLVSIEDMRHFFNEALLYSERSFDQIIDAIWKHSFVTRYQESKLFNDESWIENFEIFHNTAAFDKYRRGISGSDLVQLAKKYPKNIKLYITKGGAHLKGDELVQVVKSNNKYLRTIDLLFTGATGHGEDVRYEGVTKEVLQEISQCKKLISVNIMVSSRC